MGHEARSIDGCIVVFDGMVGVVWLTGVGVQGYSSTEGNGKSYQGG